MKKILLSVAIIATSFTTIAQVGIGTTTPKGALQVTSTTSGVIIPQFADLTAIQAITKADGTTALDTDEQGMQVYNIAEKKNYLWDGTSWVSGTQGLYVEGDTSTRAVFYGSTSIVSRSFDDKWGAGVELRKDRDGGEVVTGDYLGSFSFKGLLSNSSYGNAATISSIVEDPGSIYNTGINKPTSLVFSTTRYTTDSNPTAHMKIDRLGNVGLGTLSPERLFHLSTAGSTTMLFESTGASLNKKKRFISTNTNGQLVIGKFSDDLSSFENHLLIGSSGDIGVGTTTPSVQLEVNGYIKVGSSDTTGDTTPVAGMMRYNTTSNKFEGYTLDLDGNGTADDAGWVELH
jgi:hypothetical protein